MTLFLKNIEIDRIDRHSLFDGSTIIVNANFEFYNKKTQTDHIIKFPSFMYRHKRFCRMDILVRITGNTKLYEMIVSIGYQTPQWKEDTSKFINGFVFYDACVSKVIYSDL